MLYRNSGSFGTRATREARVFFASCMAGLCTRRSLRPLVLWPLLVGLVLLAPADGWGQLAKDLPPGTESDAVIRAYGWPKGRASSGDREIWTYPAFQVVLVEGRVVSVSALPAEGKSSPSPSSRPTPSIPPPVAPSGIRATTPPSGTSVIAPPVQSPPQRRTIVEPPRKQSKGTESLTHPTTPSSTASGPASPSPAPNRSPLFGWFPLVVVTALALAAGIARTVLDYRRKRRPRPPNSSPAPAPQTFEEHVAEKLRNAGLGSAASVEPSATAPALDQLTLELLRKFEWKRFELLVSRYFSATGIRCECSRVGADGGVDAYLYRHGEGRPFGFVQCKAWSTYKVGLKPVRELFGVMAAEAIAEGYFVTTSTFTQEARDSTVGKKITLIDGDEFQARFNALPEEPRRAILAEMTTGDYTTPTCPRCDVKLVRRDNAADGSSFWGCRNYPRCRYTLNATAPAADRE